MYRYSFLKKKRLSECLLLNVQQTLFLKLPVLSYWYDHYPSLHLLLYESVNGCNQNDER